MKRSRRIRGFTMVELMVSIAMASALAAVSLPRLVGQRIKACQAEVISLLSAMDRLQRNAINDIGRPLKGFELVGEGGLDPKTLSGTKFYEFSFSFNPLTKRVRVVAQDTKQAIYPGWPDVWQRSWKGTPAEPSEGDDERAQQTSNAMSAVM